jgi:hypothetical protein
MSGNGCGVFVMMVGGCIGFGAALDSLGQRDMETTSE